MATHAMDADDRNSVREEFSRMVNMDQKALRDWLKTDESRSVGMTSGGEKVTDGSAKDSVGHHMGERILEMRAKKAGSLTDQDFADMRKVVGYIHRHMAQRPKGDISDTRWRKSLMNWGHDPA
jgi:hypothetical protein